MKRKILPYNPRLKELARKLRNIVDFYCKDLMLAIEIDGITHSVEDVCIKDDCRQKELECIGVNFFAF